MKTRTIWSVGITLVIAGLFLTGCGGAEQTQTETPATQTETQAATAKTAEAYPLDYCIVSGEKLGGMGDPVSLDYKGRTIKFCCNSCVGTFKEDPEMYIAKIDSAAAGMMPSMEEGGMEEMEGHEGHNHGG